MFPRCGTCDDGRHEGRGTGDETSAVIVEVPSPLGGEGYADRSTNRARNPLCLRSVSFSASGRLLAQPPAAEKKTVLPLDPKIVGELGPFASSSTRTVAWA